MDTAYGTFQNRLLVVSFAGEDEDRKVIATSSFLLAAEIIVKCVYKN